MNRRKIAVLRGGPSHEYAFSLKSGGHVLRFLPERYEPIDILIDRGGQWHRGGFPIRPERAFEGADGVFNALHGSYGEDGVLQQELSRFSVPHTGSGVFGSTISMNKHRAKKSFERAGIKTPVFALFEKENVTEDDAIRFFRCFPFPVVVKPASGGGSIGVSYAETVDEFLTALRLALSYATQALVEEYIAGKEVACAVVERFRDRREYSLLPAEIFHEGKFHTSSLRERGDFVGACPAPLSNEEKKEVERLSALAHIVLQLRHYSQSEFIVSPRRGIYLLETDSLPHLYEETPIQCSLEKVGSSAPEFYDHVLSLALSREK